MGCVIIMCNSGVIKIISFWFQVLIVSLDIFSAIIVPGRMYKEIYQKRDLVQLYLLYLLPPEPKEKGGIQGITYPLLADTNKTIADAYDVLMGQYDYDDEGYLIASNTMISYRGLFLIDKKGIIQHMLVNNLPLGRNVDEALRMLEALIFHEENGEVCPANWSPGKKGMKDTHEGVADYLSKH